MNIKSNTFNDSDISMKPLDKKAIIGGSVGNFITWFEYAAFGFLAVIIAEVFFPSSSKSFSLLATFAAFASAFMMVPLGAFVFGRLGDKFGRKNILALVIVLMSGSTFAMGLLPSFSAIGVAAPILLVALRMIQGFASGGEPGGATTYLLESAGNNQRAYAVSFMHCSSLLANVSASILVMLLYKFLDEAQMLEWGWRLPFLIAGPIGIIAFLFRRNLDETETFNALKNNNLISESPIREAFKFHWKKMLQTAGCMALQAAAFYFTFVYIQTYLSVELNLTPSQSAYSTIICLIVASISVIFFAKLSDKVGRRPLLFTGALLCILCAYPVFLAFNTHNLLLIFAAHSLLGFILTIFMAATGAALVEMFPPQVRYAGYGIGFNLSIAVFGGSAPYLATYLIYITESPTSPALIPILTGIIALITVLTMKETAFKKF
ncbi:proline/betaine transporter [Acinetobacter calcoaceticus]